jgi:hypothetical protein
MDDHNHDGTNSPKVDIYDLKPLRILTTVPTLASTGDQVLSGTMYLVHDPSPGIGQQTYRLYAFIDGDWRDLTDK